MSILLLLILASLGLAIGALAGFVWAVRTGQYEDTCTPGMRVLMEESQAPKSVKPGSNKSQLRDDLIS